MSHTPNLLPLKILVISLGALLLGGFVFLVVTITQKVKTDLAAQSTPCADAVYHYGAGATVASVTTQDKTVQITLTRGDATDVVTVDRCTGNLLHRLRMEP